MTDREILEKVERERFYGTISLKYAARRLELIRKEEIKPTAERDSTHVRFNF